ncbi:transposase [Methanobrevibacter olleyae]|uniref:Transposase n=1 Tax=Methanobrevibacter olleyae TaxID=294671 RepID=A0A126R1X8_METOL|nr:transposase [Methanobrevibacter olleyae]
MQKRLYVTLIPENTKKFIQESIQNKPFKCLTTDLFPMYINIADELGVKHQLCIFHLFNTINHKIKTYCRINNINKKEKERIYENAKELKNCIIQYSSKKAIDKFKNYLQDYDSIPEVLMQFVNKHVLYHFKRYIEYLDDENIEKTSNKVENYYRQTNPEKIKKTYKTKNGILTFLDYQMKNWTKNHIKIK